MTEDTKETVWQLARRAECLDPDSSTSPGAKFLEAVASEAGEIIGEDFEPLADVVDVIHERADALVPVYTYERWQVFTDLGAWEQDIADYETGSSDMTEAAGVALYIIAERLLQDLLTD
jgi:hypothetical protein